MKIFAMLAADGAPVKVQAGQPFTTFSVVVADDQEAAWSFTPVGDSAAFEVNHPANALNVYGPEDLARFGIVMIDIPDPQEGEILASVGLGLEDGAIVADPVFAARPPPPVPMMVTRAQFKTALNARGIYAAFKAEALSTDAGEILWSDRASYERQDTTLNEIGAALALDLDDLFRLAVVA